MAQSGDDIASSFRGGGDGGRHGRGGHVEQLGLPSPEENQYVGNIQEILNNDYSL